MTDKNNCSVELSESVSGRFTLYSLRNFTLALESIGKQEIERYDKKLSAAERELALNFTSQFIRKIVNVTAVQLTSMAERTDVNGIPSKLSDMFDVQTSLYRKKRP
jgi:bisphosphoglycerate-dependent phosphoglycerate mutase